MFGSFHKGLTVFYHELLSLLMVKDTVEDEAMIDFRSAGCISDADAPHDPMRSLP